MRYNGYERWPRWNEREWLIYNVVTWPVSSLAVRASMKIPFCLLSFYPSPLALPAHTDRFDTRAHSEETRERCKPKLAFQLQGEWVMSQIVIVMSKIVMSHEQIVMSQECVQIAADIISDAEKDWEEGPDPRHEPFLTPQLRRLPNPTDKHRTGQSRNSVAAYREQNLPNRYDARPASGLPPSAACPYQRARDYKPPCIGEVSFYVLCWYFMRLFVVHFDNCNVMIGKS